MGESEGGHPLSLSMNKPSLSGLPLTILSVGFGTYFCGDFEMGCFGADFSPGYSHR